MIVNQELEEGLEKAQLRLAVAEAQSQDLRVKHLDMMQNDRQDTGMT